jgi:hypothetical protein
MLLALRLVYPVRADSFHPFQHIPKAVQGFPYLRCLPVIMLEIIPAHSGT